MIFLNTNTSLFMYNHLFTTVVHQVLPIKLHISLLEHIVSVTQKQRCDFTSRHFFFISQNKCLRIFNKQLQKK